MIRYGGHDDQLSHRYWGMDRFRIRALEKTLALETLPADYRNAALQTLLQKLAIVIQGAEKRRNRELASRYQEKLDGYLQLEIAP